MKPHAWLLVLSLVCSAVFVQGAEASQPPNLQCLVGPITKQYGNTPWLVYSCDDHMSVVIVTAPNSPATPFYFFFYRSDGGYNLRGEGTGDKHLTDAAYAELKLLTDAQIMSLVAETQKLSAKK
ncbi:hypothetical protein ACFFJT_01010 [Dyella flava]|uniref:Uncharacterized protein n=1 Tax=Dyella flava TaxID=1920170 RepID=A0ABS2K1P2_9GAMM|nr:hypothetical protein [Dyella flava]MBM7124970.1 hypothetical protein [Dyella flava]GLQ49924.1 hypothetical protein GCM10010872_13730 [Dyella flava]